MQSISRFTRLILFDFKYFFNIQATKQQNKISDTFLIHLVSSVNKLMTQHVVDIQNLEKKFQENMKKMEKELEQKLQKQQDIVVNQEKKYKEELAKQNKEIDRLASLQPRLETVHIKLNSLETSK